MIILVVAGVLMAGFGTAYVASEDVRYLTRAGLEQTIILEARRPIGKMLTDQRTVRFIHGYGTGQLRRALASFLQAHPLVARFDSAPAEQGGGGVTVVELKD